MSQYQDITFLKDIFLPDRHSIEDIEMGLQKLIENFYLDLTQKVPLCAIHFGYANPATFIIEKLFKIDQHGFELQLQCARVGHDCMHILKKINTTREYKYCTIEQALHLSNYLQGSPTTSPLIIIGEEDKEFLVFFQSISGEKYTPPCYIIQFQEDETFLGGVLLQGIPERPLSLKDQEYVLSQASTLCLLMLSYRNLWVVRSFQKNNEKTTLTEDVTPIEARIIGSRDGLSPVMDLIKKVAPLPVSVMISGESGTGKELIARAIHDLSRRRNKPFITINCGAIPEGLLESELFGHHKGAFTGASSNYLGYFEQAHGGTIFLDEVGELPLRAQVKFLRILEDRIVEPLGSARRIPVDVRVLAATNRDLEKDVQAGTFRMDLWHRLRAMRIHLPPLRERSQDIPALSQYFLNSACKKFDLPPHKLAKGEMDILCQGAWSGNVRELKNTLEEALITCMGQEIHISVGQNFLQKTSSFSHNIEHNLSEVVTKCKGRINGSEGAAALLDLKPSTLRSKLDKCGISYGRNWKE